MRQVQIFKGDSIKDVQVLANRWLVANGEEWMVDDMRLGVGEVKGKAVYVLVFAVELIESLKVQR